MMKLPNPCYIILLASCGAFDQSVLLSPKISNSDKLIEQFETSNCKFDVSDTSGLGISLTLKSRLEYLKYA